MFLSLVDLINVVLVLVYFVVYSHFIWNVVVVYNYLDYILTCDYLVVIVIYYYHVIVHLCSVILIYLCYS